MTWFAEKCHYDIDYTDDNGTLYTVLYQNKHFCSFELHGLICFGTRESPQLQTVFKATCFCTQPCFFSADQHSNFVVDVL